jgi:hypothetical protein
MNPFRRTPEAVDKADRKRSQRRYDRATREIKQRLGGDTVPADTPENWTSHRGF